MLRRYVKHRAEFTILTLLAEFAFYVNKTGWRSRKDFMIYWEGSPTGFGTFCVRVFASGLPNSNTTALHYPYILAFEPTFVEIRSVLTSSISQIIQGNNLRLLFADTPPSTTNSSQFYSPYQQQYGGYNHYGSPSSNGYASRPSLQNGHGSPYPNPYQPRAPSTGRDEILMVSDDRVMRVQPRV